jgi:hypothetical protein
MARCDREQTGEPAVELHDEARAQHARRHRWAWITVLSIALVSGSALLAVPAIAAGGPPDSGSGSTERVVVCDSGVIDHADGISTSSATAERVAADAPVPDGCTAQ